MCDIIDKNTVQILNFILKSDNLFVCPGFCHDANTDHDESTDDQTDHGVVHEVNISNHGKSVIRGRVTTWRGLHAKRETHSDNTD